MVCPIQLIAPMTRFRMTLIFALIVSLRADQSLPPGVLFSFTIPDADPRSQGSSPSAVTIDSGGNTYAVGSTQSGALPTTSGAFRAAYSSGVCRYGGSMLQPVPILCSHGFVVKTNSSGNILFLTYFGGTGDDAINAVAVDRAGNIWIAGYTTSPDLPVTANAAQKTLAGELDGFLAELNSTGSSLLYSTYIGGTGTDVVTGLALTSLAGSSARPYVTGRISSVDFPVTSGSLNVGSTCFVTALAPDGHIQSSAQLPGTCSSIAVNGSGSVYVAGAALSTDRVPITPGAWQTSYGGGSSDAFVAKLDGTLSQVEWASFVGGSGIDASSLVRLDGGGDIWLAGTTSSQDFPILPGSAYTTPPNPQGGFTGFIVRLKPDGSRAFVAEYLPGEPVGFSIDRTGDAVVAFTIVGSSSFTPGGLPWPCQNPSSASPAGGVEKLDPFGTQALWATWTGPSLPALPLDVEGGGILAVDGGGNAFVAGNYSSLGQAPSISVAKVATTQSGPAGLVSSCVVQAGAPYATGPLAPGEIISIYGAGFGPQQGVSARINGNTIGTELGGIQVLIEGTPAPLLYVSATQINLITPYILTGRTAAHISIVSSSSTSNEVVLPVADAAPEIFEIAYGSTRYAAVLNQDGTVNSPSNPAHTGDIVSLFASGAGPMTPPGIDGEISQTAIRTPMLPVQVIVDGVNANITYEGEAPGLVSGAFQVNFQIPPTSTFLDPYMPYARVQLKIGNQVSSITFVAAAPLSR